MVSSRRITPAIAWLNARRSVMVDVIVKVLTFLGLLLYAALTPVLCIPIFAVVLALYSVLFKRKLNWTPILICLALLDGFLFFEVYNHAVPPGQTGFDFIMNGLVANPFVPSFNFWDLLSSVFGIQIGPLGSPVPNVSPTPNPGPTIH